MEMIKTGRGTGYKALKHEAIEGGLKSMICTIGKDKRYFVQVVENLGVRGYRLVSLTEFDSYEEAKVNF